MNFSQINFGIMALKIYGVFLSIAFFIASWDFYKRLEKYNFSINFFVHHYWRWVLCGVLVGRIFSIILSPEILDEYQWFSFFAFWEGDFSFHGMLLGMGALMYWDLKKNQKSFWSWVDLSVHSFLLGILVIDIAAFLTGAIYGTPTSVFWAVQYETFDVEIVSPVHPVTLYAAVGHLALLHWSNSFYKKYSFNSGALFFRFAFYFLVLDFLLQFITGNQIPKLLYLSYIQWFDILFLSLGAIYYFRIFSRMSYKRI